MTTTPPSSPLQGQAAPGASSTAPGTALARGIPDELCLLPPGTAMHEDKLRCGLTFRWYERGPRERPCAILLHGYPEIAMSWKHQLAGLSESYRVVAVDMRGCGASEGPYWFWHYTLGRLARDPVELMEVLGVEQVHLVGHDWGAAVAWESAARFPHAFKSLSIINCPPLPFIYRNTDRQAVRSSYAFRFMVPFWWNQKAKATAFELLRDTFHVDDRHREMFPSEAIEAYAKHVRRAGLPMMNYYRAGMLLPPLRLRRVRTPTRLIWGLADPWMNPWFGNPENYASFVSDIDAVHLEGVSHFAQQQAPASVNEALLSHWQAVDTGTRSSAGPRVQHVAAPR